MVGPSGCGKSTLLKLIAGFSAPSAGRILFQGEEVRGLNTKVGYVPQESKLFPWLTVEENVGFGLDSQTLFARGSRAASRANLSTSRDSPVSKNIIRRNYPAA